MAYSSDWKSGSAFPISHLIGRASPLRRDFAESSSRRVGGYALRNPTCKLEPPAPQSTEEAHNRPEHLWCEIEKRRVRVACYDLLGEDVSRSPPACPVDFQEAHTVGRPQSPQASPPHRRNAPGWSWPNRSVCGIGARAVGFRRGARPVPQSRRTFAGAEREDYWDSGNDRREADEEPPDKAKCVEPRDGRPVRRGPHVDTTYHHKLCDQPVPRAIEYCVKIAC